MPFPESPYPPQTVEGTAPLRPHVQGLSERTVRSPGGELNSYRLITRQVLYR
jgi:hypothetical protein